MSSIKFRGVTKVTKNMRRSAQGAQSGAVRATRILANEVLRESQTLVPVRTGNLKASGRVQESLSRSNFTANVSYGARDATNSASYAAYVHEDLNVPHAAPTMAKFIEIPWVRIMADAMKVYKVLVGRGIDREVRR